MSGRSKQFDVLLQEQRERRRTAVGRDKSVMASNIKSVSSDSSLPTTQAAAIYPTMISETARTPSSLVSCGAVRHHHPALAGSAGTVQSVVLASARNTEISRSSAPPTLVSGLAPRNVTSAFSSVASGSRAMVPINATLSGSTGAVQMGGTVASRIQRSLSVDGAGVRNTELRYVHILRRWKFFI